MIHALLDLAALERCGRVSSCIFVGLDRKQAASILVHAVFLHFFHLSLHDEARKQAQASKHSPAEHFEEDTTFRDAKTPTSTP